MEIYNNDGRTSGRRASTCSYCGNKEHNATNCPRVAEDYVYFTKSPPVIPIGISTTTNTRNWYAQPRYWGEWYEKCKNAHAKQVTAKKKASTSRTGTARSAPKCGFCGSTAHNRRNCDVMDRYTADAIEANRNWRRAFYKKFVRELGISEGALLNVKTKGSSWNSQDGKEVIGVVTAVNWDELSLFCASPDVGSRYCYRDGNYKQFLQITVQIGDKSEVVQLGDAGWDITVGNTKKNLVKYSAQRYAWGSPEFISVLSPSETPIGDEWIEEGHAKAMAFLTKKRSKAKLDEADVTKLIKKWL